MRQGPGAESGGTQPVASRVVEAEGEVVYECPDCEERYVGERRCPECNLWCRRVGRGGHCPSCDEIVTLEELA